MVGLLGGAVFSSLHPLLGHGQDRVSWPVEVWDAPCPPRRRALASGSGPPARDRAPARGGEAPRRRSPEDCCEQRPTVTLRSISREFICRKPGGNADWFFSRWALRARGLLVDRTPAIPLDSEKTTRLGRCGRWRSAFRRFRLGGIRRGVSLAPQWVNAVGRRRACGVDHGASCCRRPRGRFAGDSRAIRGRFAGVFIFHAADGFGHHPHLRRR